MERPESKKGELLVAILNRMTEQVKAYKWFDSEESKGASLAECVAKAQVFLPSHNEPMEVE